MPEKSRKCLEPQRARAGRPCSTAAGGPGAGGGPSRDQSPNAFLASSSKEFHHVTQPSPRGPVGNSTNYFARRRRYQSSPTVTAPSSRKDEGSGTGEMT